MSNTTVTRDNKVIEVISMFLTAFLPTLAMYVLPSIMWFVMLMLLLAFIGCVICDPETEAEPMLEKGRSWYMWVEKNVYCRVYDAINWVYKAIAG